MNSIHPTNILVSVLRLSLYTFGLFSILSCGSLKYAGGQPEELRMKSYEDGDGERFDDVEYDDGGVDDRMYGLDECIMMTRDDAWKADPDSMRVKKRS